MMGELGDGTRFDQAVAQAIPIAVDALILLAVDAERAKDAAAVAVEGAERRYRDALERADEAYWAAAEAWKVNGGEYWAFQDAYYARQISE